MAVPTVVVLLLLCCSVWWPTTAAASAPETTRTPMTSRPDAHHGVVDDVVVDDPTQQGAAVNCMLDADLTNPHLTSCLAMGKPFIEDYVKLMKRGKMFNACGDQFKRFHSCMSPLFAACHNIKELHTDWHHVLQLLQSACIDGSSESTGVKYCVEEEMASVMSKRCEDYYRFNRKQNTRGACHFLHHHFRCREALVTSACGPDAGVFAFHALRLASQKMITEKVCEFRTEHNFELFGYTEACSQDLVPDINRCLSEHLDQDSILAFRDDLIVIARNEPRRACRKYKEYTRCLRQAKRGCEEGARLVFNWQGDIRVYMLKMDYICSDEVLSGYTRNLACYHRTLEEGKQTMCEESWEDMGQYMDHMTAHKFYCQESHADTVGLRRELDKLTMCFDEVFTSTCNKTGASYVSDLIRRVFEDPSTLKLDYKPDCQLHSPDRDETQNTWTEGAVTPTRETRVHNSPSDSPTRPTSKTPVNETAIENSPDGAISTTIKSYIAENPKPRLEPSNSGQRLHHWSGLHWSLLFSWWLFRLLQR